jgi:hypothetical protein
LKRSEAIFLTTALILAAVLGGLIGEVVGSFLPDGAVKTLFVQSVRIGFDTIHANLYTVDFSFGMYLKLNFVSVLCVILVLIYYRWWYL